MPIADWTVPFSLTSSQYAAGVLVFNTQLAGTGGIFLLRPEGCQLANVVRATKEPIPQADGEILHRRFVEGMEMTLAIQLWETTKKTACAAQAQAMLDKLGGYLYGLLNAGDNEGRISWQAYGVNERMLDDIRLLEYPAESHDGSLIEITVKVDTAYPYAEDLLQLAPSVAGGGIVTNSGNRPTYPVWQIHGNVFTLTNTSVTPNVAFSFDSSQPGCPAVGGGATDYVEIDTLRNTVTIFAGGVPLYNGSPGIVMPGSDFFLIPPGANTITATGAGAGSRALINAAWA